MAHDIIVPTRDLLTQTIQQMFKSQLSHPRWELSVVVVVEVVDVVHITTAQIELTTPSPQILRPLLKLRGGEAEVVVDIPMAVDEEKLLMLQNTWSISA